MAEAEHVPELMNQHSEEDLLVIPVCLGHVKMDTSVGRVESMSKSASFAVKRVRV